MSLLRDIQKPVEKDIDSFWGEDISILFSASRLVEFFPTSDQNLAERVNSITRMILYVSLALAVYQKKSTSVYFGILLCILIYFMWKNKTISEINDAANIGHIDNVSHFTPDLQNPLHEQVIRLPSLQGPEDEQGNCVMPTAQNPFMNRLAMERVGGPPACKGPGVQEQAANLLNEQLFSDVDDLFDKKANQRLFRTMPETTGVSDNTKFANWLIKGSDNCKEDGVCPPYEDPRMQRQLIPEDLDKDFDVSGFSL